MSVGAFTQLIAPMPSASFSHERRTGLQVSAQVMHPVQAAHEIEGESQA